jgi:fructose-1-phosphate kinase PfkB-like protein
VAAGADLVATDQEALATSVGHPLRALADAVEASAELQRRGAHLVLADLGPMGALLVDGHGPAGAAHAEPAVAADRAPAAAADAALAGFLFGLPDPGRANHLVALMGAVTWGAAARGVPGHRPPGPADVRATSVRLHDAIDQRRLLPAVPDRAPTGRGDRHAVHLG